MLDDEQEDLLKMTRQQNNSDPNTTTQTTTTTSFSINSNKANLVESTLSPPPLSSSTYSSDFSNTNDPDSTAKDPLPSESSTTHISRNSDKFDDEKKHINEKVKPENYKEIFESEEKVDSFKNQNQHAAETTVTAPFQIKGTEGTHVNLCLLFRRILFLLLILYLFEYFFFLSFFLLEKC